MRASTSASMLFSRSFCFDHALDLRQECLALLAARLDGILDLVVGDGIDVLEGEVLEFSANLAHAETVGDGRVDFLGFARNLHLALGRQMLQRAHVVQAVGQLDEHDADVVDHGQHHLADALGLGLFAGGKIDFADLGDALDDVRDLLAEFRANVVDGDRGVFDGVVQQAGGDSGGVETHVGQHGGHFQRMHQVGLARGAGLALVMARGEVVGLLDQSKIVVRAVAADFAQ